MCFLSIEEYIKRREAYSYADATILLVIHKTNGLNYFGEFHGIYPGFIPDSCTKAINLRKFEAICQDVFSNCCTAMEKDIFTEQHEMNLKSVTCAIVHWKMASQGGRANKNVKNIKEKWTERTINKLLAAYLGKDVQGFMIPGIRIPTATAFMRFLFPDVFGIMDSRVARLTEKYGITNLSIRQNDGYINDTARNITQYRTNYIPFLNKEAKCLKEKEAKFIDFDMSGKKEKFEFRPCDVEMALWESISTNK